MFFIVNVRFMKSWWILFNTTDIWILLEDDDSRPSDCIVYEMRYLTEKKKVSFVEDSLQIQC